MKAPISMCKSTAFSTPLLFAYMYMRKKKFPYDAAYIYWAIVKEWANV